MNEHEYTQVKENSINSKALNQENRKIEEKRLK